MNAAPRTAGPGVRLATVTWLAAAALLAGCGGGSTTAPGPDLFARLGMSSNPSDAAFASPAFGDSITWALVLARDAGATVQVRAPQWNVVEAAPGAWNLGVEELFLGVHRTLGISTFVNMRIVDTNSRNVPPDLAALAWDDSTMIRRVDVLVDTLAALVRRHDVVGVAIGNEVDAYFSLNPAEFPAFLALYRREVERFHAAAPGVPIGITTTNPFAGGTALFGDSLNVTSDLVVHTFYDFYTGSLMQRSATQFDADLEAVVARAHGKPVAFQEVGYASSPLVNGSLPGQAEAVRRFRTWLARQPRSRVAFACWFDYTDWSSVTLQTLLDYYGVRSPEFVAYLGSLGLRDSLGRAKPAWETFRTTR